MENNGDPKQLIIDRVKQVTNILVTVENDPSVDELAAALALTLMLNKMDKHATAVFSGAVPPAINFLDPGKTFESTVDSLRDFIIALDKEKADRLRYKVEDDVVKIYITPYQSTISEKDLRFSQGDFNVELVLALGVEKRESLDRAIAAHGRILHDATVITINARDEHSNLGMIDWQDGKSSSICEMLVSLGQALQPKMLDAQMSTALLTGIVAATDRFSNARTTPHVMTLAAELMAAGANQQLIANSLQNGGDKKVTATISAEGKIQQGSTEAHGGVVPEAPQKETPAAKPEKPAEAPSDGSKGEMKVWHDEEAKPEAPQPTAPSDTTPPAIPMASDELSDLHKAVQSAATNPQPAAPKPVELRPFLLPEEKPVTSLDFEALPTPAAPATPAEPALPKITPLGQNLESSHGHNERRLEPPTLGGTLNATSAEAEEDRRHDEAEEASHNNVMLNHGGSSIAASGVPSRTIAPPPRVPDSPMPPLPPMPPAPPMPAAPDFMPPSTPPLPPMPSLTPPAPLPSPLPPAPTAEPTVTPLAPTLPQPPANAAAAPQPTLDDLEAARRAVSDALLDPEATSMPPAPSAAPAPSPLAQPLLPTTPPPLGNTLPALPNFATLPPLPADSAAGAPTNPMQPPSLPGGTDVTAQFAAPGSMPTPPPLPPTQQPPVPPAPGQVAADPSNPSQFRIPGQ